VEETVEERPRLAEVGAQRRAEEMAEERRRPAGGVGEMAGERLQTAAESQQLAAGEV
jgi:hypothetical protein